MICGGVDGGSRAIKVVLLDCAGCEILASGVRDQGVDHDRIARELFDELLESTGLARTDVARVVATGYTRGAITFADTTVTEITCHAAGVRQGVPDAATVVEIGGQDSKLLRLSADGTVRDFAMNDRCAAGTGRFLEVVASRLGVGLDELGEMARAAQAPASISSMCVVFAETEIIGLLASGESPENIVAGVQASIASRVAAMLGRDATPPVLFTGGVALIPGMTGALASAIGADVTVAPDPQMTGALGAAIVACRQAEAGGGS
ncbi:MAG TPA: acyl-CoA dehydratase activase [Phycisphaerae bacterium]|nr:acyl-CoA dehydratase activase [Phycisphaerae bacterium]